MLQGKPKVTLTLPMPSGTLPQCPQSCCKRAWRKSKHQNDDMAGRSFSLARTRRKKKQPVTFSSQCISHRGKVRE